MPKRAPFPSKETDLNTYFKEVVRYLLLHFSRLNVSETNRLALIEAIDVWNTVFPASQNKNLRTTTIVANKNAKRDQLITLLRSIYDDFPKSGLTTDDKNTFGLKQKSTSKTLNPRPTTYPIGTVDVKNRLSHTISFTDEDGSLGKPKGVRGCQIWYKIGEPVTHFSELNYLVTDTASPYLHQFDVPDVGKMVHYWLRWENTRGETGPWSPVVSATVVG